MSAAGEPAELGGETRRVPRFLSCLVKGPLGCLAFALGAATVFVLLLPPALGRVLDRTLEREFEERYAGHLELGDAWLGSFYGKQRVERVILRDPDGDEVLRGELRAPSLAELLENDSRRYGPVELRIDLLHLVEDDDGTTNLERALEEIGEEDDSERDDGPSTDMPFRFGLEVMVARLRTTNAQGRATELADLAFNGKLEWGPEETRLELEGGSDPGGDEPLRLRADLSRPEFGRRRPWSGELELEGAPTALARALCAPVRALSSFLGARADRVSHTFDGNEIVFRVEDDGARFELAGDEIDGVVTGSRERVLSATLPCGNRPGAALLATLLPLVGTFECLDPEGVHELRLAEYRWPVDGDWSALSGELELALAPARCTLVPPLRDAYGDSLTSEGRSVRLHVRDGVLEWGELDYAFPGGRLHVRGTLELENGDAVLIVDGEHAGTPVPTVRLVGTRGALRPELPRPEMPRPPGAPADEVPLPPEQDG